MGADREPGVGILPDLRGLEDFETEIISLADPAPAVLMTLGLLGLMLVGAFASGLPGIGLVVVLPFTVYLVWGMLRCDRMRHIDSFGITTRGTIGCWRVEWSEVVSARLRGATWYLETQRRRRKIPSANPKVAAGVWQHLRRQGKAGPADLPEGALALWRPVPNDVPRECGASYASKSWGAAVTLGVGLLPLGLLGFATWLALTGDRTWIVLMALLPGVSAAIGRSVQKQMRTPILAEVGHHGLQLRFVRREIAIGWDRFVRADWVASPDALCLVWDGGSALIPMSRAKEDHVHVALAAVRQLRERNHPLAVALPVDISLDGLPAVVPKRASLLRRRTWQRAYLASLPPVPRRVVKRASVVGGFLAFAAIFGVPVLALVNPIGRVSEALFSPEGATMFVRPFPWASFLAIFACAACASEAVYGGVGKAVAGRYREEWNRYRTFERRFTGPRVALAAKALLTASIVLGVASLGSYVSFTQRGLVVGASFGMAKQTYSWRDIRAVSIDVRVPRDRPTRAWYVIDLALADGRHVGFSSDALNGVSSDVALQHAEKAALLAGVQIEWH